jgi:hypothetical protein
VTAAVVAAHVASLHVLHFKPAAGTFYDFLLFFCFCHTQGLTSGAFNRFMTKG